MGRPRGAQPASSPPPSEEEGEPEPPVERPRIFQRRDSDAKTPDDEQPDDAPTPEPSPTPGPHDQWPEIARERLMDADDDGDGRPDRFGPDGPILGDDDDLDDIVAGPPIGRRASAQLADAGAEQAPGGIAHPDDGFMSAGGGMDPSVADTAGVMADLSGNAVPLVDRADAPGVRRDAEVDRVGDELDDDITSVPPVEPADASATVEEASPGPLPEPDLQIVDDIAPAPLAARPGPGVGLEPDPAPVEPEPTIDEPEFAAAVEPPVFEPEPTTVVVETEPAIDLVEPEPEPAVDAVLPDDDAPDDIDDIG